MPVAQARLEEGSLLVDRLAELVARKKEVKEALKGIEEEERALEAEILRYAESRRLLAVQGRRGHVTVSEKEEIHLPTKTHSPANHDRMEEELKASPLWPQVSKLDGHRLVEGLKEGQWDETSKRLVEELLLRYATRTTARLLRFHPVKEDAEE